MELMTFLYGLNFYANLKKKKKIDGLMRVKKINLATLIYI